MIVGLKSVTIPPRSFYKVLSRALNTLEPHQWPSWCKELCGNKGLLESGLEPNGDILLLVPEGREPKK